MKTLATVLFSMCVACGADSKSDAPAESTTKQDVAPPAAAAAPTNDLAVTVVKNLPYCEMTNNGAIVYSTSEKKFKACDATTGTWYDVNVEGPKGDKGEPGDKGERGVAGDKGEQGDTGETGPQGSQGIAGATGPAGSTGPQGASGSNGVDGQDGKDGQIVNDSMWYDPIADQYWTFTILSSTFAEAQATCVGDWRLPTAAEWKLANLRGLTKVITTSALEAWLSDGTKQRYLGDTVGGSATAYCVENT